MTLRAWLAMLRRRWLVLTSVLLVTCGAMAVVHERPIAYQACGSVLLLPPQVGFLPNVYIDPRTSLVATSGLLAQKVMAEQMQQRFRAAGLTASYTAQVLNTGSEANPTYTEPLVYVCSLSYNNAPLALKTTDAVIAKFDEELHLIQARAHVSSVGLITDRIIAPAASVPILGKSKQALLGVALAGLIAAISLAMWSDRIFRRRMRVPPVGHRAGRTTRAAHRWPLLRRTSHQRS